MKIGDVVLRKHKFCPVSLWIRFFTKGNYSHAMIAIDDKHVLEVSSSKKITAIEKYKKSWWYEVKFFRPINLDVKRLKKVLKKEMSYEFKRTYGTFKFMLLRYALFNRKIDNWTCSAYVAFCLEKAGWKINDKYYLEVYPSDFEFSDKLKEIEE